MGRAGSRSSCGSAATGWASRPCARGYAATDEKPCSPSPSSRAPPIPRTGSGAHPNLLLDQPRPIQANRVWVSDITYLPLASRAWAYLCAFQDVCTKQVVGRTREGWQVRADMPEALVTSALQRALLAQRPAPGLIVHSDRGRTR